MITFCSAWRLRFVVVLLAALFALPALSEQASMAPLAKIEIKAGIHLIRAEVADNDASRSRGLMFRQTLGASEGMLFVFQRRDTVCFWMRNTYIPLSIAFLDDDGGVANIADMAPQSETPHCSTRPVRYALEMNQGWFGERGITVQSVIEGLP